MRHRDDDADREQEIEDQIEAGTFFKRRKPPSPAPPPEQMADLMTDDAAAWLGNHLAGVETDWEKLKRGGGR
ncbi:MAG: hypothetical protein WBD40_04925 [Tepidisphaeraceae bacterium]